MNFFEYKNVYNMQIYKLGLLYNVELNITHGITTVSLILEC
jgi:sporulation protein YlmC with PRC-barrel domain